MHADPCPYNHTPQLSRGAHCLVLACPCRAVCVTVNGEPTENDYGRLYEEWNAKDGKAVKA